MTNFRWLSLLRRRAGRSGKERDEGSFRGTPSVNGEYLKALRTKSYVEIWKKAHGKVGNASTRGLSPTRASSSLSNSLMHNLTEYLLEPRQEIITNMKVHRLLVDYFEASLEACRCCDTLLQAVHHTRLAYARLTTVVNDQSQTPIYTDLSCFLVQNNPLSIINPAKFRDRYMLLLHRLISKRTRIRRALAIKKVFIKVGAMICLIRKRFKRTREKVNTKYSSSSTRLCEQLDVAAKGVYILINDLDTMSRMVKRLNDEVEHWREVADICVKTNGKSEILKQVVTKEFHDNEYNFADMLEELEEHICLCFLTVNRSRRLVIQEITETQC